jgi:DNA-directed RNA polymerase subunit M/transcription elongation factor TFIIS
MYCPKCSSLLSHSGNITIENIPHNYKVYSCGTYVVNGDVLQSDKCMYLKKKKEVEQLVQKSNNIDHELFDQQLLEIIA